MTQRKRNDTTQQTLAGDESFPKWLDAEMKTCVDAKMSTPQMIARINGNLPQRFLAEITRGGIRPRIESWLDVRDYVADHSQATTTGAPRVKRDQLSFDGAVDWIVVQRTRIDASEASIDTFVTEWCATHPGTTPRKLRAAADAKLQARNPHPDQATSS